jgi:hypothetical protein
MLHGQPIRQDDYCFGTRSTYALKRRLDLGGRLHLSKRKPNAEPVGALLGFFQLALSAPFLLRCMGRTCYN